MQEVKYNSNPILEIPSFRLFSNQFLSNILIKNLFVKIEKFHLLKVS